MTSTLILILIDRYWLVLIDMLPKVRRAWATWGCQFQALCFAERPHHSTAPGTWNQLIRWHRWSSPSSWPWSYWCWCWLQFPLPLLGYVKIPEKVWAVKWYRGNFEIFRFIADEEPPTKIFKLDNFDVDVSAHHGHIRICLLWTLNIPSFSKTFSPISWEFHL